MCRPVHVLQGTSAVVDALIDVDAGKEVLTATLKVLVAVLSVDDADWGCTLNW